MKRVIIFGCSGGIGSAIAKRLSLSFSVSGVDQVVDPSIPMFRADLRIEQELEAACAWAQTDGPLWALVFTAGIYPIVPFETYTLKEWDEVFAVNVRAAFYVCSALTSTMTQGGRIILLGSAAGHSGSRDLGYSSSKAALLGLTRSLAQTLAPKRILVNAICPGPIVTEMSNRMTKEHKDFWRLRVPLGRFGDPDEVVIAVEFLLDDRNTFMTGSCIDIDGGLTLCR